MSGEIDETVPGEVDTISGPTIENAPVATPDGQESVQEPEPAPVAAISVSVAPHPSEWRIGPDDTLESIALAAYGDVSWASAIQMANHELVPTPGILPISKTLILPD